MFKRIIPLMIFIIVLVLSLAPALAQEAAPGLPVETIEAYPVPNVTPLAVNDSLLYDRIYRRVNGAVTRHETPNGPVASTLGEGFNFVTVRQFADGWAEVSPDRWMPESALSEDVDLSRFSGVLLPEEGLPYPMAWTLVNLWPSKQPGASPSEDNPFLYRYSRVNIYTSVEVDGWLWYQIGIDQWVKQTHVAMIKPVPRTEEIDTERWISVDLYEQVVIAYEGDRPVFASLISSGMADWPTNEGIFHIYLRYPRTVMSGAEGLPDFYYLEEVPWTMYFDDDIALHGAYWHNGFGYRRSHGCVNMTVTDAHWLYQWSDAEFDFTIAEDEGPAVLVYSSGEYR